MSHHLVPALRDLSKHYSGATAALLATAAAELEMCSEAIAEYVSSARVNVPAERAQVAWDRLCAIHDGNILETGKDVTATSGPEIARICAEVAENLQADQFASGDKALP